MSLIKLIMKNLSYVLFIALALAGCKGNRDITSSVESITTEDLKSHISILASDDFGGRAPATDGEQKTIDYLAGQFEKTGLKPANNGSWFQEVSMIKITADEKMEFTAGNDKEKLSFSFPDDFTYSREKTRLLQKMDRLKEVEVAMKKMTEGVFSIKENMS